MENGNEKIHVFERAGLGKAPFKFVGVAEIPGKHLAEANPSAYMNALAALPKGFGIGTCNYCGQAIMINCLIVSSDGHKHAVGSDCIRKVGDAGLVKAYKKSPEYRAKQADARAARAHRVYEELVGLLGRDDVREAFSAMPHPYRLIERATGAPLTAYDYVIWMKANAGDKGRLGVVKWIKRVLTQKES